MDALKELKDRLVDYLLPLAILAVSIVSKCFPVKPIHRFRMMVPELDERSLPRPVPDR